MPEDTQVMDKPAETTDTDPASAAKLAELQAVFDRRGQSKEQQPQPKTDDRKPAQQESGGIRELRRAHDETLKTLREKESAIKERETKLAEMQTQLSEFEGTRKERDELKTRIDKYEQQLAAARKLDSVAALEISPEFRKLESDRTQTLEGVKKLAGFVDIPERDLLSALNADPESKERFEALDTLLSGVSPTAQQKLLAGIEAYDRLNKQRTDEINNADERMRARIEAKEREERQRNEEKSTIRSKAWDETAPTLAKELGLTDAEVAEGLDIYRNNRDAKRAVEIILTHIARKKESPELAELRAEVAKYRVASPDIKAGGERQKEGPIDTRAERAKLVQEWDEIKGLR